MQDGPAPWTLAAFIAICHIISVSIMEPLYVAGGFALYINRRTLLEGWDIEVAFRRLARRLTQAAPAVRTFGPAVAALVVFLGAGIAHAQSSDLDPNPSEVIQAVLADPDFGGTEIRTEWHWPWLEDFLEADDEPQLPSDTGWLGEFLAAGGQFLMWVLAAVLVAVAAVLVVRQIQSGAWRRPKPATVSLPDLAFGHTALPETLPEDVPAAAWALWETGEHALALGMLYAGAIHDLVLRRGVQIPRAATEGICLRAVRAHTGGELAGYFAELTRAWLQSAYAHRPPEQDVVRGLCGRWSLHFQGSAT
jgi:hypothetical protein